MRVKILEIKSGNQIDALIKEGTIKEMPSIQDGWRFNFNKELSSLKNATGYLLVTEKIPSIVEGAMIFQLIKKKEPYLAMIEVAPHNRNDNKQYGWVAGCMIAYAFKLSVLLGVGDFKAWLQLRVLEENKEDEMRLMEIYSKNYNARQIGNTTTMVIYDQNGEDLVERYLPSDDLS